MLRPQFGSEQVDPILGQIYEGMAVHDRTGRMIGTVEHVYRGEVADSTEDYDYRGRSFSDPAGTEGSLIEEFANAVLLTERLSDTWRERLLSFGFIKIKSSGLFTSDRYAMPSQIVGAADDRVFLDVDREQLVKA